MIVKNKLYSRLAFGSMKIKDLKKSPFNFMQPKNGFLFDMFFNKSEKVADITIEIIGNRRKKESIVERNGLRK